MVLYDSKMATEKLRVFILFYFSGPVRGMSTSCCTCICCHWQDIYFHLTLTSHLLPTALTRLLQGLIILFNSHLTSHEPFWLCYFPEQQLFYHSTLAIKGRRLHRARVLFPTVDLHGAGGKYESIQWNLRDVLELPELVWLWKVRVCLQKSFSSIAECLTFKGESGIVGMEGKTLLHFLLPDSSSRWSLTTLLRIILKNFIPWSHSTVI